EQQPPIKHVLMVGAQGLRRELIDVGLDVIGSDTAADRSRGDGLDGFLAAGSPDAVVVGLDPEITYLRLAVAADAIRAGARFVATNRDPTYPFERGLRPGAGALVPAIEAASGVVPVSIGKPAPLLLEEAARAVGGVARGAVMVGECGLTDLAAARAAGRRSVPVL